MSDATFKAVRPDGRDFRSGTIDYLAGGVVAPYLPEPGEFPGEGWLHVATVPTECVGMRWPCRFLEVEPVVRELPAWQVFGPQGERVVAVIDRAGQSAASAAARAAASAAARAAAWDAARAAAATVVSDLVGQHGFTREHYDTLMGPWRQVTGDAG